MSLSFNYCHFTVFQKDNLIGLIQESEGIAGCELTFTIYPNYQRAILTACHYPIRILDGYGQQSIGAPELFYSLDNGLL